MPVDEHQACAPLAEAELVDLVMALRGADVGGVPRRRLDRAPGRAEQALLAHQLVRRASAH